MNDLIPIPCVMMRGGTSKGPFFLASDLPANPAARDAVLLSVMGSGHPLQIDGIGGGNPVTSKVAIVGPGSVPGADVDYLFAQVNVLERIVDTGPNCGNMLSAVGAFAIEQGLVTAQSGETRVKVHNVNTGKIIEARIQTRRAALEVLPQLKDRTMRVVCRASAASPSTGSSKVHAIEQADLLKRALN